MQDDRYAIIRLLTTMQKKEKLKRKKATASEFIAMLTGKLISYSSIEMLIRQEEKEVRYLEAEKDTTRKWPAEPEREAGELL